MMVRFVLKGQSNAPGQRSSMASNLLGKSSMVRLSSLGNPSKFGLGVPFCFLG